jgi:UDP-N-acetyl-2-amino-2-deoxyglucuronate dehydrogenase
MTPRHTTLRVGIVGCGNIAGNHLTAFRGAPDTEVVACCDVDAARAAAFAARYGVPAAVGDVAALLDRGVDVVTVCTPHPTHEQVVVAAAARGAHVLCEKPIAIDLAAAGRMIAACDAAGVTFGALFQRRFWPAAQRIRAAIDDGTLGTPFLGHAAVLLHRDSSYYTADAWRGTWASDGGGVLTTQAVHYLDLLQWFMGECVEVNAAHATVAHPIEVEDTAVATLRFASGGLATVSASTAVPLGIGTRVLVTGPGGTAGVAEYPEGSEGVNDVWAVPGAAAVASPFGAGLTAERHLAEINAIQTPFHALQIAEFVDAVRAGREPAVTGREATKSLAILTALYASARSGRPQPVPSQEATAA